jgi:thiol-disulfide isomerase/thioredoxin
LALGLPLGELIVALALVPAWSARAAAFAAALLFLLFLALVSYQLAKGRHPACHCFGQLHSKPIGMHTLVRNGTLALLAALVAGSPAPSWSMLANSIPYVSPLVLTVLLGLGALVAAEGWLLLNLARQQGRLLLRLDEVEARLSGRPSSARSGSGPVPGLPVGAPAPDFELPTLEGSRIGLQELRRAGRPILLLSVDPSCGPCASLLPEVAQWQPTHEAVLSIAVLSRGSADLNRRRLGSHGISPVLLQQKQEVAERYQALATPSAVLISGDGHIAAPLASGPEEIRHLVERTVRTPAGRPQGLAVGSSAPAVHISDLDGTPFQLSDRVGQPTVLLFWNPACGFCHRMLPDLERWEAEHGGDDSGLLLVSSGMGAEHENLKLRSTVLLDSDFSVGRSYGASGTPSAVLVREGKVASELAVGAPAVLGLLAELSQPTQPTA